MVQTYLKLKTLVENVTGYSLPDAMPAIGMQVDISIPYFDIYEKWDPAKFVYLGGENLYLTSPTTGETYKFNGLDKNYQDYKAIAIQKRDQERTIRVNQLYERAKVVKPTDISELSSLELQKVANFQQGKMNEEIAPVGWSELRMLEGKIYQAFYSEYIEESRMPYEKQIAHIVAVRDLASGESVEYSPRVPFCQHIHRFKHSMPSVWVAGYKNAIKSLKRLPDFTVKEAFNLDFLINTAYEIVLKNRHDNLLSKGISNSFNPPTIANGPHSTAFKASSYKDTETWFALTPKQLKTFNSKLEEKGIKDVDSLPFSFILLDSGEHE